MTADELAKLTDAELSRLVAEQVMGWFAYAEPDVGWFEPNWFSSLKGYDDDHGPVKLWSITDPAAYMAVVDAMVAQNYSFELAYNTGWQAKAYEVEFWKYTDDIPPVYICGIAHHVDIGRAIAIAALMAIREDKS